MIGDQVFEAWREDLNQANKLCRTYAALIAALCVAISVPCRQSSKMRMG